MRRPSGPGRAVARALPPAKAANADRVQGDGTSSAAPVHAAVRPRRGGPTKFASWSGAHPPLGSTDGLGAKAMRLQESSRPLRGR